MRKITLLFFAVFTSVFFFSCEAGEEKNFSFGLIGDLPYLESQEPELLKLIEKMNEENLAFVAHDGDIKSGQSECSNELFQQRKKMFETSIHPFIYVPGDNDWTDCHRSNNGSYDPIERLNKLRQLFFADEYSLGQNKITLTRQSTNPQFSEYRENVRWVVGSVMFVGLNIPGSNNNLDRTEEMDIEYKNRSAANDAWLIQSFQLAKANQLLGIMIIIQANPHFTKGMVKHKKDGYRNFRELLLKETLAFKKPVVLVHGDTHDFRVDQPLYNGKTLEIVKNFTRLETFGHPYINWVKVTVNPEDPKLFQIEVGNKQSE